MLTNRLLQVVKRETEWAEAPEDLADTALALAVLQHHYWPEAPMRIGSQIPAGQPEVLEFTLTARALGTVDLKCVPMQAAQYTGGIIQPNSSIRDIIEEVFDVCSEDPRLARLVPSDD